jgi:leader peptidase (prepilin peptidase)/N-methyltransferase
VRLIQLTLQGRILMGLIPAIVFGGGLLILSLVMDKILKRDSMGGGDIKLMAVLGLYFSAPECLLLLIIACVVGIVVARVMMSVEEDAPFPFGPALSVAAYITLLIGQQITHWYLSLF